MIGTNQLITEIRNRIQFLVTISIFLFGVIYAFFKVASSADADKLSLYYPPVVVLYLFVYLFFENAKKTLSEKSLEFINKITLWGVSTFCLLLIYISSVIMYGDVHVGLTIITLINIFFSAILLSLLVLPVILIVVFSLGDSIFKKIF